MKKYIFFFVLISSYYIGIINPVFALETNLITCFEIGGLEITSSDNNSPFSYGENICLSSYPYHIIRGWDNDDPEEYITIETELLAIPAEGYIFDYWNYSEGEDGSCGDIGGHLTDNPIAIIVNNGCFMKAIFIEEEIPPILPPAGHKIITLGVASGTDMVASIGTLFSDLWLILALVIGIPLAFYIIQRIIKLVPADKKEKEYMERKGFTAEKEWKEKSKKDIIFTETKDIHGHKQITGGHYKKDK